MQRNKNSSLSNRKILGVASVGGHWIELLRILKPLNASCDIAYVSTHPKSANMVDGCNFHSVVDFSRWDFWKALIALFQIIYI